MAAETELTLPEPLAADVLDKFLAALKYPPERIDLEVLPALDQRVEANSSLLGVVLQRLYDSQAWRGWQAPDGRHFTDFRFYCETRVKSRSGSVCMQLMANWRWWRDQGYSERDYLEFCAKAGWKKAMVLRDAKLRGAQLAEAMELVCGEDSPTVEALKRQLVEAGPEVVPEPPKWVQFKVSVPAESWPVVEEAMADAKRAANTDHDGVALVAMATAYLARAN